MHEETIKKLLAYMHDNLPKPDWNCPDDIFRQRSYARSTVYELIGRIMDCPFSADEEVLWDYIQDIVYQEEKVKEKPSLFEMYTVMWQTAMNLLNVI